MKIEIILSGIIILQLAMLFIQRSIISKLKHRDKYKTTNIRILREELASYDSNKMFDVGIHLPTMEDISKVKRMNNEMPKYENPPPMPKSRKDKCNSARIKIIGQLIIKEYEINHENIEIISGGHDVCDGLLIPKVGILKLKHKINEFHVKENVKAYIFWTNGKQHTLCGHVKENKNNVFVIEGGFTKKPEKVKNNIDNNFINELY